MVLLSRQFKFIRLNNDFYFYTHSFFVGFLNALCEIGKGIERSQLALVLVFLNIDFFEFLVFHDFFELVFVIFVVLIFPLLSEHELVVLSFIYAHFFVVHWAFGRLVVVAELSFKSFFFNLLLFNLIKYFLLLQPLLMDFDFIALNKIGN